MEKDHPMTRYLSLHRFGLPATVLFVGITSLHAQTNTNSGVPKSTLGPDTPQANRVLLQNSGVSRSIIPDPETILGHRLLLKLGAPNATTPRENEDDSNIAAKISTPAFDRAAATHKFFVTDLGTLGGTESFAYAINDSGQVVGLSRIAGDVSTHSFLYNDRRMTDLYPFNSQNIQTGGPTGINNSGQIASGTIVGGVYSPAILDSRTGGLTLPGTFGGVTSFDFNGVANSINNRADAVGSSYIDAIKRHAFLYSNGLMRDIDPLGGYSAAIDINDEGAIVGFASAQSDGTATAFLYSQGLTTLIFPDRKESYANGVNNLGQVVGEFLVEDESAFHAFLYSERTITDLGSPDSPETVAYAINDQQQVIGTTWVPYNAICFGVPCVQYTQHAFLYESGNMADLNTMIPLDSGWVLSWGFDINNRGQIVGYGLVDDKFRAFLLTPAVSKEQCKDGGWESFGFKNPGQCIQFALTGK